MRKKSYGVVRVDKKVVDFDILRINQAARKFCRCTTPHYELDSANRVVTCTDCGALVDPFEALRNLAHNIEHYERCAEYAIEERKKLDEYKPRLRVIKYIEEKYSGSRNSMVPSCPICGMYFDLTELQSVSWRSRTYHEKVADSERKKEGRS